MRSIIWSVGLVLAAVPSVFAADFEGEVILRTIRVDTARLVTMLGAAATDPEKVFEVPIERFAAMKDQPDVGAKVQDVTLLVRGTKVRAENIAPTEPNAFALIDTANDSFTVARPKDKSYFTLPTAKMEADTLAAAENLVRQQLDKLPPDKRAQAELMLKQKAGGAGALAVPTPVVKPLGKTQQIAGFQASAYEIRSGDETTLGWVAKDSSNLSQIFKFFQQLEKRMRSNPFQPKPIATAVVLSDYGIPLRAQIFGARDYQIREVLSIKPKKVDPKLMEIPKDFVATKPVGSQGQ